MESITYHTSNLGNRLMVYNGYEYLLRHTNEQRTLWRCRKKSCKSFVKMAITDTNKVTHETPHDHQPRPRAKIEAGVLANKAKKLIKDIGLTPRDAMNSVLTGAGEDVLAVVPGLDSFTRNLLRYKSPGRLTVKDFKEKHEGTVLYDSGLENERRLIITGEKEMIPKIEKEVILYFDSSLPPKVRPGYLMYRVHAKVGDPPCLFVLLTHKDEDSILLMFKAIKEIVPGLRPTKILTDVEQYTLSAARQVFPLAKAKICYFRFSEIVIRKINSIGLKSLYDESEESREYLKSITSLAFVQPEDVKIVFNLYSRDYPDSKSHIKFIKYFRDTFIGTETEQPIYPIEWWNHYNGVMRGEPTTSKSNDGFVFTKTLTNIVNQYHSLDKLKYLKMLTRI